MRHMCIKCHNRMTTYRSDDTYLIAYCPNCHRRERIDFMGVVVEVLRGARA